MPRGVGRVSGMLVLLDGVTWGIDQLARQDTFRSLLSGMSLDESRVVFVFIVVVVVF